MKDICRFILESTCRRSIVSVLTVISVRASRAVRKWHEILRFTYPEGGGERQGLVYVYGVFHFGNELTMRSSEINPRADNWL